MNWIPKPSPSLYANRWWLIGSFAAIVFFAVGETDAFRHPDTTNTLSHFIASIGAAWSYSIFLFGMFVGVLSAHFFWPWQENPMGKGGG